MTILIMTSVTIWECYYHFFVYLRNSFGLPVHLWMSPWLTWLSQNNTMTSLTIWEFHYDYSYYLRVSIMSLTSWLSENVTMTSLTVREGQVINFLCNYIAHKGPDYMVLYCTILYCTVLCNTVVHILYYVILC